jgi:hypothetical protein
VDNVSQSARDAAKELMEAICEVNGRPASFRVFLTGQEDEHFAVQAFAQAEQRGLAQGAAERAELVAELEEQARIVGAGGERELALMAEVARLRDALECAPIVGRGEEMMAFRDRQDKWLATKYAALRAIADRGE